MWSHRKKSIGVRSGDMGGQTIDLPRPIISGRGKLFLNKQPSSLTPVLIHIFTPHQQMADTISLLIRDPLHTIMQGTVTEITVAGALIMKPNISTKI